MSDKYALVTGASSGIGRALAHELANRGYDLIISSAGERLDGVTAELKQRGVQVVEAKADLATTDGVSGLWNEVESTGRKPDIACINAGIGVGGLFVETDLKTELSMISLNCAGTVQ
jgi:short-subunit dehydrogenase